MSITQQETHGALEGRLRQTGEQRKTGKAALYSIASSSVRLSRGTQMVRILCSNHSFILLLTDSFAPRTGKRGLCGTIATYPLPASSWSVEPLKGSWTSSASCSGFGTAFETEGDLVREISKTLSIGLERQPRNVLAEPSVPFQRTAGGRSSTHLQVLVKMMMDQSSCSSWNVWIRWTK